MAIGILVLTVAVVAIALLTRELSPSPMQSPTQSSGAATVVLHMRS